MRPLLAETAGTFVLVLAGTGAIVLDDATGGAVTHAGVSLAFGLAVLAMILAFGKASGAHLNPAVTLGLLAAGRFPGRKALPYLLAQVAGALLASASLRLLFPAHPTLGATLPAGSALESFGVEVLLAWLLMLVILLAKGPLAPAVIGAVVALEAWFAGPVSGASMNPARSLAPALVSGHLEHLWIYLTAPVLGALLAVGTCRAVCRPGCCPGN